MLVIDKSKITTRLIVTLSEANAVTSGSTIQLKDQFSNVDYSFGLPDDSSLYPERFNSFEIDTSVFSALTPSTYSYIIKDATNTKTETGLLKVVDSVLTPIEETTNEYVFIQPTQGDEDFLVYQQ